MASTTPPIQRSALGRTPCFSELPAKRRSRRRLLVVVVAGLLLVLGLPQATLSSSARADSALPAGLKPQDWAAIRALVPFDITQQAYVKASNTDAGDHFGYSVAVSGDTVAIAAYGEASNATGVAGNQQNNAASNAGAVYVLVRNGSSWMQQAYLKASNTEPEDLFGSSVAISGDTIVVGAWQEDSASTVINQGQADNSAPNAGAAYVFVRDGTTWTEQAYLKASNTQQFDRFGVTLAIAGNTIVVGAWGKNEDKGAAYVFERTGTTWNQQQYLQAINGAGSDVFGFSVGISGNTIIIGAYGEDSDPAVSPDNNQAPESGAAYVFERSDTTWSQQAMLKASNAQVDDQFGVSVAISGETIVVGALQEDSASTTINSGQDDDSASAAGAAYVFTRSGTSWTEQAYLKASNTGQGDSFGSAVAISDDSIIVAALREDSNATGVNNGGGTDSFIDSGAAYVFTRSDTNWLQQAYIKASNTSSNDRFGISVAISGTTIMIGADQEDSSLRGINNPEDDNDLALEAGAAYILDGVGPATPTPSATSPASRTPTVSNTPTETATPNTTLTTTPTQIASPTATMAIATPSPTTTATANPLSRRRFLPLIIATINE